MQRLIKAWKSGGLNDPSGFLFWHPPRCSSTHCPHIQKKFNARSWLPCHLRSAGIPENDLCKVYASTIEYAAPVYHPLLTLAQSEKLEKLQQRVLKSIDGYNVSYKEALERSGLDRLSERREEIFRTFCIKLVTINFSLTGCHLIPHHDTVYAKKRYIKKSTKDRRDLRVIHTPV